MKPTRVLLPLFGLVASASAQRQVLVTYSQDTPLSVVEKAKEAVLATGGIITEDYSLIKSFAATVSSEVLETINALSSSHKPIVEDDTVVTIQQQEPLEQ
ncbi:MAG: hypothetical protein Q9182_000999 [Xanthomendoza sp. 2 TL-2023]